VWTLSIAHGPRRRQSMVDLGQGVGDDLTGVRPNSCFGARRLTGNGAIEREEHGEFVSGLTGVRVAAWR
jgi:hypothetical protein